MIVARRAIPSWPVCVVAAIAAGVAFGIGVRALHHGHPALAWAAALGVPWLLAAIGLGALAGERRRGTLAGALALTAAVGAYYATFYAVEGSISFGYAVIIGVLWALAAAAVGGACGWIGAALSGVRERAPVPLSPAIAGLLVGEGLLLLAIWGSPLGRTVALAELAAGGAAALVAVRHWEPRRALVLAAGVAGAVVVAEAVLRVALRAAGWAGP